MTIRKVKFVKSTHALLEELRKKGFLSLSSYSKFRKIFIEMEPERLIQLARAELDVSSNQMKLSRAYFLFDKHLIDDFINAIDKAGFIFHENEENDTYVRRFLTEEIMGETYGTVEEYESRIPYPPETMKCFDDVLFLTLSSEENDIVTKQLYGDTEFEDYASNKERAEWLYELALNKLKGDLLKINWARCSDIAEKYLGNKSIGSTLEDHLYKNAIVELKRIYHGKNDGKLISPYWMVQRRNMMIPSVAL